MDPKKAELIIKQACNGDCECDKADMPEKHETMCMPEEVIGMDEEVPTTSTDDLGQKIINAIHEITSNDIPMKNALRIFAAHRHGADTEHSIANITGIDAWTCKKVLDILHGHGLLNLNIG